MKDYLLTLVAASLIAAFVGILTPDGERGGLSKHMKLLTSLFLICVLIAPVGGAVEGLKSFLDGGLSLPSLDTDAEDNYREELDAVLDDASAQYFADMLTQTVESQFSIATGDVACRVAWTREDGRLTPARVTVILSGKAIWQDPKPITDYVSALLGCECTVAID